MDTGDWSLLPTAPGFVKRYNNGCRRIVKRHQAKMNRAQGKRVIVDETQPHVVRKQDRSVYYSNWTRNK